MRQSNQGPNAPLSKAFEHLAKYFHLPFASTMQDWEYEVADPNRIEEFIIEFEHRHFDTNEQKALLNIILQSFEDSNLNLQIDPLWNRLSCAVAPDVVIHQETIDYWAMFGNFSSSETFRITPAIRKWIPTRYPPHA